MNKQTVAPSASTAPISSNTVSSTPGLDVATIPPGTTSTAPDSLPAGYLAGGYYATTEKGAKYLRTEYVSSYAQALATGLASINLTDFRKVVRDVKKAKKASLPFEARKTAVAEMLPKALMLVHRGKAPTLIVDWVKANQAAIKSDEDWYAYYRHLEAIAGYMIGGDT